MRDDLIERLHAYIAQRDGGDTVTECNGEPLTLTDLRQAAAEIEALTKGLRVAVIALAHASETDATYRPAYQHISDMLADPHIADAGNMVEALRADLADYMQTANAEAYLRIEDAGRLDWLASEALRLWGIRDRGWYDLPRINIQSGCECCDPGDLRYAIDQASGVDAVAAALKQEDK